MAKAKIEYRGQPQTIALAKDLRRHMTEEELLLWDGLRSHRGDRLGFRRQHPIGKYVADFCCPRAMLIVEVDGEPHRRQAEYDAERTAFFESMGYRVLRFWNSQIRTDLDRVLQEILNECRT